MRFRKSVPLENQLFLKEELKRYKKEVKPNKDELRELEKWVARGRSPYDNGDYIYTDYGIPMDFVSAMRWEQEQQKWIDSLSEEEREAVVQARRYEYDTESNDIAVIITATHDSSDSELPFT